MGMFRYIFQDWNARLANPKSRMITTMFRLAQLAFRLPKPWWWLGTPYLMIFWVWVDFVLGIDLSWRTEIGPNFQLMHAQALVINYKATIGSNCVLRSCTTIGVKMFPDGTESAAPVLGNNVDVGANACIIGPIHIGDGAVIGAGAVVVKDVPPRAVVAGNPARVLRILGDVPSSE